MIGMVICLGTTPAVQRVMIFDSLAIGEVNRARQVIEAAAGKSVNAAKVVHVLGSPALAMGFAGGNRGQFLCSELDRMGIAHDLVTVQPRTRLCVTLVDRGQATHTELCGRE